MPKERYKGQNEFMSKKIIIAMIVSLVAILAIFLIALNTVQIKKEEKEQAILSENFSSIKDILEYYGCKFIKTTDSQEEGFSIDIYTTFPYGLYDEDKSNEKFYQNVIDKIAQFLNYESFRMIDKSKEDDEIEIKVVCQNKQIETIYINGIEDYFIYMDSQISLKKYKELKTTELSVQAPQLLECMQNNWSSDCNFGTRETIFQKYFVYFDEGIKTRKIDGKIYNIVFDSKYLEPVINGFTVGTNRDIIISRLGNPTFQNNDGSVIGYKSRELYAFFSDNQISIYRNNGESGFDKFFSLVDEFLEEKYTLLEFMNELTYLWPGYEEYTYDAETVFLSYPNKGIDIKINYDNMDGIILYNNIGVSQEVVNQYLEHTEFVAQLQVDNVFNAEMRRIEKEKNLRNQCKEFQENFEKEDTRNRGKAYDYYMKTNEDNAILGAYFISQNEQFPNCELSENIDTYIWIHDDCFVYSKVGKGIYYYDLRNQTKGTILTGDEPFKIKSYENGVLKYDEKTIQVQY